MRQSGLTVGLGDDRMDYLLIDSGNTGFSIASSVEAGLWYFGGQDCGE